MRGSTTQLVQWAAHRGRRAWRSVTRRVMSITALGMGIALLADILLAARLGTEATADALIIALTLPRFIEVIGREGTKFSLLALFTELAQELSRDRFQAFVNRTLNLFLMVGLGLTVSAWLLAPGLMALIAPGLALADRAQAVLLFRLSVPLVVFALGAAILGALLNSRGHFAVVATRNSFMPAAVVLAIGLAWGQPQISVWIAGAHTVGYGLFYALLYGYSRTRLDFRPHWRAWPTRKTVRQLWPALMYPTLGFGARQGTQVIERALASLVGGGGVSSYYFAFRLASAAQTMIGVSLATIGLPGMTRHDLSGARVKFDQVLRGRVKRVVLVSSPIALGLWLFHGQLTGFLYGRGAFGLASIQQTGQVLQYLGAGLVFLCLLPVLNSALYAQRRYAWVLFNMIFLTAINIFLAWWLSVGWGLGLAGIAAAFSITGVIAVVNLSVLIRYTGHRQQS